MTAFKETKPLSQGEVLEILAVVQSNGLTPETLKQRLMMPAFTKQNVQHYLNHCSPDELAQMFYIAGIQKVVEAAARQRTQNQNAPTPNQPETSTSPSVPDDGKSE